MPFRQQQRKERSMKAKHRSLHMHDPYEAFRVPSYRLYVCGWFIALLGTRIQGVAISWEVYQRTGEALALGMVGLMQALPTMILALPAGYLADRFHRRTVIIVSSLGMASTALGLAVLSMTTSPISLIYVLLLLDATAMILGRPARVALLPQIVPPAVFPNAVTWGTSLQQLSAVLGAALGGFVVAISVPAAFVISAASSLLFVVLLIQVDLSPRSIRPITQSLSRTLVDGIHFVWKIRLLLVTMALDMFAVLLGGAVYLLPIFAENILQVGPQGFGWLRAAPAVGAFCMALLLAHLPPMHHAGRDLLLAVAGFGIVTIIFGFSTSFWLSLAMLFLTGAFDNVSMVIRQTLVQLLTPDQMRGRVSAVGSVFISASNELGGVESGLVAHWFGSVFSVVSGGMGTIVVVLLTALLSPELRTLGALHEVRPVRDSKPDKC
jgi:MFS family permease